MITAPFVFKALQYELSQILKKNVVEKVITNISKRVKITPIVCGRVGVLAFFLPRGWPLACGLKDREKVPFLWLSRCGVTKKVACGRKRYVLDYKQAWIQAREKEERVILKN
ncbi:hypothetical protein [Xanthocytophaga agilis]|uniref:Uncharacterized protein n=1 Tax=Xanthocytophaga agilis TaxID=3048010 RepID=A0AAE3UG85_9BACT|nr:hypothetical protein [Xanthocytophaga agilis]MDJ1502202.1 hypothetical protein [Xanthocytophaga agilis]